MNRQPLSSSAKRRIRRRTGARPAPSVWLAGGLAAAVLLAGTWWSARGAAAEAQRAAARLGGTRSEWVTLKAEGQRVLLLGQAPDDAARRELVGALATARCGTWAGDVSCGLEITDQLTLAPPPPAPSAYAATIRVRSGKLSVDAELPNRDVEQWLQREVKPLAGASLGTSLRAGRPLGELQPVLGVALRAASNLVSGTVTLTGTQLAVTGTVADAAAKERLLAELSGVSAPFQSAAPVLLREDEVAECEHRMQEILAQTPVAFVLFAAELKHSSKSTIRKLGALLATCPGNVRVEGHTDNVGDPNDNLRLSQERAGVVVEALIAEGVAPERLAAVGLGETRPIATNHTRAGRTKNRRIELALVRPSAEVKE